jgi:alkylation response protein AidB-like acyl-CoA dehydrogenase
VAVKRASAAVGQALVAAGAAGSPDHVPRALDGGPRQYAAAELSCSRRRAARRALGDIEVLHSYEGTETMQALIVGRDITGIGAFA